MDVENSFIRPILTFYYGKGMSEFEAYEEVSKKYGPRAISLKTIRKWYEAFKPKDASPEKKRIYIQMQKFTDDFLINLVNENPDLNMKELAKLADCSDSVISRRIRNINKDGIRVDYRKKGYQNNGPRPFKLKKLLFTDEYLVDLVNENPDLSMNGLAKLANCSKTTILNRLNQINSSGVRVNYIRKNLNVGVSKFTDKFLIDMINNNPNLNIDELAEFADCKKATITHRLKLINSHKADDRKIILKADSYRITKRASRFTDEFIINLVNDNPMMTMKELANLASTSENSVSRRIKKINSEVERVKYIHKSNKKQKKFTDEYLINLINENPDLSMIGLSKVAGTSKDTISKRIKQINSNGEKVKYVDKKLIMFEKKFTDEFLVNLINENPGLSMDELAKLTDCSKSAISKILKRTNSDGADKPKKNSEINFKLANRDKTKFTDNFLINLVNDNPSLNMQELASLAGTSRCTISRRIKQINSGGERVNYIMKN